MKSRKKVISFVLTLMLVLGLVPMGLGGGVEEVYAYLDNPTYRTSFATGYGTATSPYAITNAAELTSLAALVNGGATMGGIYFEVGTAINLSGTTWTAIGTNASKFQGQFDGKNNEISNLTYSTTPYSLYIGLFGYTSGAAIKDLNLSSLSISAISGYNVGGLVGYAYNTTISGVTVSGIVTGYDEVGGLVGYNKYGNITDSYAICDVKGRQEVGGLVGYNEQGNITDSYATGDVTGSYLYVGGLVGYNYSGKITDSYTSGNIEGTGRTGGLIGANGEDGETSGGDIEKCYATGDVTTTQGAHYVGGLVGNNYNSDITDSYATGEVTGYLTGDSEYVGGLVGYNEQTIITSCYAIGAVTGYESVGGLVGYNDHSNITSIHAIGAVNGSGNNIGGLVGYSDHSNITSSHAIGDVNGSGNNIGGLIGYSKLADIKTSYATGNVSGSGIKVGGLAGYNASNITSCYATGVVTGASIVGGLTGYNASNITSCYATSKVTGINSGVGGLVGQNLDGAGSFSIISSYATGNVKGTTSVGGLVGDSGGCIITSSYAIGKVIGTSNFGGLIGVKGGSAGPVSGCFWDTERSTLSTDGSTSSTGLSTANMKLQSTFTNAGWDFTNTWAMGTGTYKYPVFQYAPLQELTDDTADDSVEEVPAATHHHHSAVAIPEPVRNLLRFNIGNIDSFVKLGSSGEELKPMDVAPIISGNRTLLPIRFVVEPLSGTIIYNGAEHKVTITRGNITIELWIDNNVAKVNGIDKVIDPDNALIKPIIVNPGRTMLPLRFISEALGCTVDWDAFNKEILVSNW